MRWWFYCKHALKSKRRHGTHSPFVYALAEEVLVTFPRIFIPFSATSEYRYFQSLVSKILKFLLENDVRKMQFSTYEIYDAPSDIKDTSADIIIVYTKYPDVLKLPDQMNIHTHNMVLDFGGCIIWIKHPSFIRAQYFCLH